MTPDHGMPTALREATELVAREQNPELLCQLVLRIDIPLEVIERRLAELQGQNHQPQN